MRSSVAGRIAVVALVALIASLVIPAASRTTVPGLDAFVDDSTFFLERGVPNPFSEAIEEQEAPEDFYVFSRISDGGPSTDQLQLAAEQARALRVEARASTAAGARWRFLGPTNIGGRVVAVVPDPSVKDRLYVAAATGGVWRSDDGGSTFRSIWKKNREHSMGDLAIASDGTLYLGTGEANPGGGSLTYGGNGVWKSTDGGKTWTNIGLRDSVRIGAIKVDAKDPSHVLVAVTGNLFKPGGMRGLYETKDGGKTWRRMFEPPNDTTGAIDVQIDPKDPKRIYVAMWDHIRYPDWRDYAGPGSGIWRTTNGKDFERLGPAQGLPPPGEDVGRIAIGIDPQDPQRLYAIYVHALGTFSGWFLSTTGGDAWVGPPQAQANLAASQSVYGWWFGKIWVDPADSNHVYVAGLQLYESTDGGLTFPNVHLQPHVDHHAMAWDPHVKARVWNGNDGGVYTSTENGADGTWVHAKYQPWNQFFQIDVSEQDPSRINGGMQDQSSARSWGKDGWDQYNGGDGVENVINPKDFKNIFSCSQYGACSRSDDGGDTLQDMSQESARYGWLSPIEFEPGSGDRMYWAGSQVARSEDRGNSWATISPDLGKGELGREQNPLYAGHYGTVQDLGLTPADKKTIYAGTDNGFLWRTKDEGGNWEEITSEDLPKHWITQVDVSKRNPNNVFVTFSGYRTGNHAPYVMHTKDGGKTWRSVTENLPKAPVNDLLRARGRIYVATDVGVFSRSAKRSGWTAVGRGLPLLPINDIRYVAKNRSLYAGTFGRGIWSVTL